MANWLILSIVGIMAILFIVFILPTFNGSPSSQKTMNLQQFCAQWKLEARQKFFAGITQCYKTTQAGNSVTETTCDAVQTNGQYAFKGDCPLVPAPPPVKLPNGLVK